MELLRFRQWFTAAVGFTATAGVFTEESKMLGYNVAYTGDNYGVSLTYADLKSQALQEDTGTAFNGYYTPDGLPSISVGYEKVISSGVPLCRWI